MRFIRYSAEPLSSMTKPSPAQMCADSVVLDRITKMIRDAAADMEKVYSNKAAPRVGSNGSYAPPVVASEPTTSVVVDGVLAVEYNSEIDRVKCETVFHIDGASGRTMMAVLA